MSHAYDKIRERNERQEPSMKLELDKARADCLHSKERVDQALADLQAKTLEIAAKKVIEEAMFNVDSSAQKALMAIDDELLAAAAALREGR